MSSTAKWLEDSSDQRIKHQNRRTRGSALALCCAAVFILSGCNRQAGPAREHSEGTPVTVAQVTNAAWDRAVSIIGTLYGKDEATLGAQVEGSVEQTLVDFGDRVQTNQDLAFIDTGSYEAQLEQAV